MTRPRLAVLDASHGDEDTRRNVRREFDADLAEFDVTQGELPGSFAFDGVVVTGSRSSVYWDESWIAATRAWVREAIDRGLPCLGICWGHQLLADALGGTVEPMGEYEIGYRTIERTGESHLLSGIDPAFTAFTTHSDAVAEVPPDADVLAANDYCVHAFRKDRAFGVQFHPEYDVPTARKITNEKQGQISDERRRAVLDGITEDAYEAACEAKRVFGNFLAFVEAVDSDASVGALAETDAEAAAD